MLDLAVKHNANILFLSTEKQPIFDNSGYEEIKIVAETLMYKYKKKYNIDVKIINIINKYDSLDEDFYKIYV